jgi:histidine triad (HIT) family protein
MVRLEKDEALEQLYLEQRQSAAFGGCVMCRLGHIMSAHEWIAESEHGVVVLDGYGATRGHMLVVAKSHVERASTLEWEVFSDLQRLVWQGTRALEAALNPGRVYVASLGSSQQLPMSFPHYHAHIVPVYETDERARPANVFSWSTGVVRYAPAEARSLCAELRGAWPAVSSQRAGAANGSRPSASLREVDPASAWLSRS